MTSDLSKLDLLLNRVVDLAEPSGFGGSGWVTTVGEIRTREADGVQGRDVDFDWGYRHFVTGETTVSTDVSPETLRYHRVSRYVDTLAPVAPTLSRTDLVALAETAAALAQQEIRAADPTPQGS